MNITEEQRSATCQICLHAVDFSLPVHLCPSCKSGYHQDCWDELKGCATYGCPEMVEVKKSEEETASYWGATEKTCPVCVERIPISSLVCPYCKTQFKDIRPMTRDELLPVKEDPALAGYRKGAVILFIFSLLGCTSPLALLFGGIWYHSHRNKITQAGSTASALSVIGLGICVLYLVVAALSVVVWEITS